MHILVAGFVGWHPRGSGGEEAELRRRLGEGDVHAGMPAPVILDFGRLKAATT